MVRVLVIDDSPHLRGQVSAALEAAGHETLGAEDGLVALDLLDAFGPDVVVCDVNMPRLDGLGFLAALARRVVRPPVLMLTTEGQTDLIRAARKAGAAAWMIKPFQPELLRRAVQKLGAAYARSAREAS